MSMKPPPLHPGATDVPSFISDLDAGMLERMLGAALSDVAAAVVDAENKKKGEVSLKLKFELIQNTHQVRITHELKFIKPTRSGRASEEGHGTTALHVGKYGRLSLAQPDLRKGAQSNLTD